MTWEAIGAIGELVGALAVVVTLAYLATQVRYAKITASDANRLARSTGVREMMLAFATNDELAMSYTQVNGLESYYEDYATKFHVTLVDATRADWVNLYYFWLHWGQFASTKSAEDVRELRNLINTFYQSAGVRHSWENSPWSRPVLDPEFVSFVDGVLAESDRETDSSPS